MKLEDAINTIDNVLKNQRLSIAEHEVVQNAFRTLVEAAKNDNDAIPVQHPVQQG